MGASLAKELRSPTSGSCMGWMAQKIMDSGKGVDSIDAASQIATAFGEGPVIAEIGPGAGHATKELIRSCSPSRFYGIEISEAFRERLTNDKDLQPSVASGVLTVHGDDARDLKFIPDNSVELVFAFNVIYFLDPLSSYLQEFHRILKPGGSLHFGVKNMAKDLDSSVYINTDWDECLREMMTVGFEDAKAEVQRLEGPVSYIPLVCRKPL